MTQQLRHRADLEPRSQGLIWPTGGPEGCLPCCSPGHPISLSSFYCYLSPRQAVDRGHSPATIWLDTRSIWLDTHLILPLLESCSVPPSPLEQSPRSYSSLQEGSLFPPAPPPTTLPLLPPLQTHWASGQSRHTPTSGPLYMLFLPGPFPRGLHISLPRLLRAYTNIMVATRTSQATF